MTEISAKFDGEKDKVSQVTSTLYLFTFPMF